MPPIADILMPQLTKILDSASGTDIIALGWVTHASVDNGIASLILEPVGVTAEAAEGLRLLAERAVRAAPGVREAYAVLTMERAAPAIPAPPLSPKNPTPNSDGLSHIRHIIAVGSGKGGVGKSTVAANLAVALAQLGMQVGILDADIYGPSLPTLLGLRGKPDTQDKKLLPRLAHGVKAMSIGLLIDQDTAMIWRGPMATSALQQMMTDVIWGDLDVLVLDLPPGTGDIQLSLTQKVKLAGAIIVSTPQDLALIDARKAITMFQKVNVPILGLVENMSHFICPSCGTRTDIFGSGGAAHMAGAQDIPLLGAIPLHINLRRASDDGVPIMVSDPNSAEANALRDIAAKTILTLDKVNSRPAPTLRMVD
jgi:ATP-binding protein involved in chromosome partitioning